MFRSYLGVAAILSLAAVIGCDSGSTNTGGSGGSAGSGGSGGSAGTGGMGGEGGTEIAATVTLGCTNNVDTSAISMLDWNLTIDPGAPVAAGEEFTAEVGGVAFFAESFLDAALAVIAGLQRVVLEDLAGTVQVRSGATGDAVVLRAVEVPTTCGIPDGDGNAVSCDTANDIPDGLGANSDCAPTGAFNPCAAFVDLPTSDDCTDGGTCSMLGKNEPDGAAAPGNQCEINNFCITGPLPLPMESQSATYMADADATEILYGWDDTNTEATVREVGFCSVGAGDCNPANGDDDCDEGTCDSAGEVYDLPASTLSSPTEPNGVRIAAGLGVLLRCTGAVDSATVTDPEVSDLSSPSPDEALLSLPLN